MPAEAAGPGQAVPEGSGVRTADDTERPTRAPRKRAAKKAVAAAEESADELLAPTTVT